MIRQQHTHERPDVKPTHRRRVEAEPKSAEAQRLEVEAHLEKELTKFQALYDLALAMTGVHSLDENLSLLVEKARRLLGTDTSYIALRDEDSGDVYMHTLSGISTEAKNDAYTFRRGIGRQSGGDRKGLYCGGLFSGDWTAPSRHSACRGSHIGHSRPHSDRTDESRGDRKSVV